MLDLGTHAAKWVPWAMAAEGLHDCPVLIHVCWAVEDDWIQIWVQLAAEGQSLCVCGPGCKLTQVACNSVNAEVVHLLQKQVGEVVNL